MATSQSPPKKVDGYIAWGSRLMGLNFITACLITAFGAQLSRREKIESFFADKNTNVQCQLNTFAYISVIVCGVFGIVSTVVYCCWRASLQRIGLSCCAGNRMNSRIVAKSWGIAVLNLAAVIAAIVPIWTMRVPPNGVSTDIPSFGPTSSSDQPYTTTSSGPANPLDVCNCIQYIADFKDECTKYGDSTFDCDFAPPTYWVASFVSLIINLSGNALMCLIWIYAFVLFRGQPITDQDPEIPVATATDVVNANPIATATEMESSASYLIPTATAVTVEKYAALGDS